MTETIDVNSKAEFYVKYQKELCCEITDIPGSTNKQVFFPIWTLLRRHGDKVYMVVAEKVTLLIFETESVRIPVIFTNKEIVCKTKHDDDKSKSICDNNLYYGIDESFYLNIPIDITLVYIKKYGFDKYEDKLLNDSGLKITRGPESLLKLYLEVKKYEANIEVNKEKINKLNSELLELGNELVSHCKDEPEESFVMNKCPICLDHFYTLIDKLVTLSCGCHFCHNCISNSAKLECPQCSKKFYKSSVAVNRYLKDLLKDNDIVSTYENIKSKKAELDTYIVDDMTVTIYNFRQKNMPNIKEQFIKYYDNFDIIKNLKELFDV